MCVSVLYYVYVIVVVVYITTLQHGRTASPNAASIINNQSINQTTITDTEDTVEQWTQQTTDF